MADTVLHLVGMAPIGMCHCQWFREDPPVTFGIGTDKVTSVKYQGRMAVQELHTLYLAETMTMHRRRTTAATWTYGNLSHGMCMKDSIGFVTCHAVKADMPGMTFFA